MGDESVTLDQAMELMGQLQDMDELDRQVQQAMRSGDIADIDLDTAEQYMGEEARRQLERLQRIVQELEEAGYLKREGDRLELTPRGYPKAGPAGAKRGLLTAEKGPRREPRGVLPRRGRRDDRRDQAI